jgi:hypothetical protein
MIKKGKIQSQVLVAHTQETEIRRISVCGHSGQIVLKNTQHKKELVEWLKG